jgi:predicted transglutaminase-like cysteine proteinase
VKKVLLIFVFMVAVSILVSSFVFASNDLPSKDDVKAFILSDQTDKNEYIVGEYVCRDFALDVVKNARSCGFTAYPFSIHQVSNTNETHAIVLFKTSDGDVYVDVTQADNWVYIDFNTMKYEVYSMRSNKPILKAYIDWYFRGN